MVCVCVGVCVCVRAGGWACVGVWERECVCGWSLVYMHDVP